MLKYEKKLIEFIEKHYLIFSFIFITLVAFIIRYYMRDFKSGDFVYCLKPWFDYLKTGGGLKALATFPGDYNAPYMTIMALLTYLPFNELYLIKGVSIVFDFALAISSVFLVRYILKDHPNHNFISLIVYGSVLLLPSVMLNGAMWGQCDSIYATFIILSLLFLIKEKYILSFIMLGVAFAFKLQFMFIIPLYIIIYISKKKFSFLHFLIIPITNFVLCIPALIAGLPISKVFSIYFNQTQTYNTYLVLNFLNIYNIIGGDLNIFYKCGMIFTVFACFLMLLYVIVKKVKWNHEKIITLALWSLVITTFILPGMHERYLYCGEVLGIIYYIIYRKNLPLVAFINISVILTYTKYFTKIDFNYMQIISLIYMVIIIYFTINVLQTLRKEVEEK